MDRDTFLTALRGGPILVRMNDGQTYRIPSIEHATCDQIAAYVLADGQSHVKILSLVGMVFIEPAPSPTGRAAG